MRKTIATVLAIFFIMASTCGCQKIARDFGGTVTLKLKPGEKLEEITWKDDSTLWYLVRPMREGEHAETHYLKESTDFKALKGTVVIVEQEEK